MQSWAELLCSSINPKLSGTVAGASSPLHEWSRASGVSPVRYKGDGKVPRTCPSSSIRESGRGAWWPSGTPKEPVRQPQAVDMMALKRKSSHPKVVNHKMTLPTGHFGPVPAMEAAVLSRRLGHWWCGQQSRGTRKLVPSARGLGKQHIHQEDQLWRPPSPLSEGSRLCGVRPQS